MVRCAHCTRQIFRIKSMIIRLQSFFVLSIFQFDLSAQSCGHDNRKRFEMCFATLLPETIITVSV